MNATNFVAGLMDHKIRASTPFANAQEQLLLRFNQTVALIFIFMFSPLLLVISIMVWKVDGAPILFAHYRVGKDGKLFRCFKFRSMRLDSDRILAELLRTDENARAEWKKDQKLRIDPRITPIGHILRKTSLDELPQLLNVVRGEMNLVGPRPVTTAELTRYGTVRWHYVSVRPGITGLWQVSGRNNTTYQERVELDRQYVESRSIRQDLIIILKTIRVVLLREGAR